MKRYFRIWLKLAFSTFEDTFSSRLGAFLLLLGKLFRFVFFLSFLLIIGSRIHTIAKYSLLEMVLFYLTFQLVDILPQLFMREVYRFRSYVVSGDFDYILLRPISPLLRSLFGGSDILDIPLLCITVIGIIITAFHVRNISILSFILYIFLILNAFMIAVAFHILVLSLGVVTTEVDNAIMLYRDITQMGRVPVDIYQEPVRSVITFVVPVGIMMTIPAKILLGVLSFQFAILSLLISFLFLFVSVFIWKQALKNYSSASS